MQLEDQGDPWAFVVLFDRVFVLALVGIVYFRFGPPTSWGLAGLFALVTALFVYTTPHRFGCCVALAYALRTRRGEGPGAGSNGASSGGVSSR